MKTRRDRGDGSLFWDKARERWVAEVTVGYDGRGKRRIKKGTGRTKTEAKRRLREVMRDYEDGLAIAPDGYTVAQAVNEWLGFGIHRGGPSTRQNYERVCRLHVLPKIGARRLRDLRADEIDRWLAELAPILSTRTLRLAHNCLNRAVARAMARDKVKRNVVALADPPRSRPGRRSKSLTLGQAAAVLDAAEGTRLGAYIVVSLLTGARTEELRGCAGSTCTLTRTKDRPMSRCGARFAPAVTPRPSGPAARSPCRRAVFVPWSTIVGPRTSSASRRAGASTALCSHHELGPSRTRTTSAASSVPSWRRSTASIRPSGHRANCAIPSFLCCRTAASRSKRSRAWSATAAPRSPSRSTVTRYGR
jgi:hypothetical protein